MSGTRALLTCRLCPSPQPGWVALATQPGLRATQVGGPAKQNMPEGWGSWAALLSRQNSASENPHRIPKKRSIQSGEACKELTLSHCRCHVCLLVALTQVPNEAEERISISSPPQEFLRYSCSSFIIKA